MEELEVNLNKRNAYFIIQEETCQELCYNTSGCSFYTWYDSSEFLAHICILLTECDDQTSECSGCHSGPADCNADPQDELGEFYSLVSC